MLHFLLGLDRDLQDLMNVDVEKSGHRITVSATLGLLLMLYGRRKWHHDLVNAGAQILGFGNLHCERSVASDKDSIKPELYAKVESDLSNLLMSGKRLNLTWK